MCTGLQEGLWGLGTGETQGTCSRDRAVDTGADTGMRLTVLHQGG